LKIAIVEPEIFRRALQSITKFIDEAHVEIDKDGVRLKGIDTHDFCYVNLTFGNQFFKRGANGHRIDFGLDLSRLGQIMPTLSRAKSIVLNADGHALELQAVTKWELNYRIGWISEGSSLAEPKRMRYEGRVEIPANDFIALIDHATAVSRELIFAIRGQSFTASATGGAYEFTAKPLGHLHVESSSHDEITVHVLANYLRSLRPLIEKCTTVKVFLGKEKPIRLDFVCGDKAVFSFALSPKRLHLIEKSKVDRNGTSLPRLTASRFPDFLLYLSSNSKGESQRSLENAGLETSGGDYSRLAAILGMATREQSKLQVTRRGLQFAGLIKSSPDAAKLFLHKSITEHVRAYSILIDLLRHHPMSAEDLFEAVNVRMKRKGAVSVDEQDLSTLLGLAAWCGIVDRKMALYYFGRTKEAK
jgi:hypothetical protein